jgi:hypothetical protein
MTLLSLRGSFDLADSALIEDHQIFSYEANDLTRGWELVRAYCWPRTTRADTGSTNGQFQACFSIATDTIGLVGEAVPFPDVCNADDNRQCGWLQAGYQRRISGVEDFLANSGNGPNPAEFVLDPQTVVVSSLYLNGYTTSDSTSNPPRKWNYMVVLRPKKMNPMQTILHIIKGKGQDVNN